MEGYIHWLPKIFLCPEGIKVKLEIEPTLPGPACVKVEPKGILWQINMIQMFQGHPWHPGCNTAQCLVTSCCQGAAASSSQLQKLIGQSWRPVNINRLEKQRGEKKAAELVFYRYQRNHNSFCYCCWAAFTKE